MAAAVEPAEASPRSEVPASAVAPPMKSRRSTIVFGSEVFGSFVSSMGFTVPSFRDASILRFARPSPTGLYAPSDLKISNCR